MKIRYFLLCFVIVIAIYIYCEENNTKKYNEIKCKNDKLVQTLISSKDKKDNLCNMGDENLELKAKSACVYDSISKRVLYSKMADVRLPMASTTKIMTCIIAIEYGNLDEQCIVSRYAASMPDVQLNAVKGDSFVLKDLLYSLMLESHNDTAVVIAENIAAKIQNKQIDIDDVEKSKQYVSYYMSLMNKKARELGLKNTNFVTPNGLDDEYHYTTAHELAIIGAYAINNKTFLDITNTKSYSFSSVNNRQYMVNNKNAFLNQYEGAIGCKTGFTGKAGYCFVGAINQQEHRLVSVVLGSGWPPHKTYKWQDTKKLMDYGVNNYKKTEVVIDNSILENEKIKINNGYEKIYIKPSIYKKFNVLLADDEKIIVNIKMMNNMTAPINKNDIIGYAQVCICKNDNEFVYKTININANKDIESITIKDKFTEILQLFLYCKVDL